MDHDAGVMSEFTKDMESKGMLLIQVNVAS
jgi:hypothetical protein